jgi:hypothetical protein
MSPLVGFGNTKIGFSSSSSNPKVFMLKHIEVSIHPNLFMITA